MNSQDIILRGAGPYTSHKFLELWKRPAFRAVGPCGSQGPAGIGKGIQEWVADMHVHSFLDPIFACRCCKRMHNGQASPLVLLPRPPWPPWHPWSQASQASRAATCRPADFAFSKRAVQLGLSESSPNGNASVATQKLQTWKVCVYAWFKSHQMQETMFGPGIPSASQPLASVGSTLPPVLAIQTSI